ncbi:MAG: hypothetical protein ACK4WD_10870 [Flavobacteriales bacterium]|jgi:hypothetical protein
MKFLNGVNYEAINRLEKMKIKIFLLLLSSFIFVSLMVKRESQDVTRVTATFYSIPLTMNKVDADLLENCNECRMKYIILDDFPGIENFYRDILLLERDSTLTNMTWDEFYGDVVIITEIKGERRVLQLDSKKFVYYFKGQFFQLDETNRSAIQSLFCLF